MQNPSIGLFPLVAFGRIGDREADRYLSEWGHWLGPCNRPFGRQSFGVAIDGRVVSLAVSTSTINKTCGGYPRGEVYELARQCSHPDYRAITRVCVRLWRETTPALWARAYWPVRAAVSYANALRHAGDIYRFDGWKKVADVRGGVGGNSWQKGKRYEAKTIWAYEFGRMIGSIPAVDAES